MVDNQTQTQKSFVDLGKEALKKKEEEERQQSIRQDATPSYIKLAKSAVRKRRSRSKAKSSTPTPQPVQEVSSQEVVSRETNVTRGQPITSDTQTNQINVSQQLKAGPRLEPARNLPLLERTLSQTERKARQLERKSEQEGDIIAGAGAFALGAGSALLQFGKDVKDVATDILKTPKSDNTFFSPVTSFAKVKAEESREFIKSGGLKQVEESLAKTETQSPFLIGKVIGSVATGAVAEKAATQTIRVGKNIYVRSGSEFVPAEKVFSRQVLEKGQTFPTVGSTEEALQRFNVKDVEGKIVVQTSAPSKLSGKEAGVGKKASLGLEDPGIFTTPKGEGSPAFLRLAKETDEVEYTLNPFKGISNIPTVTEFEVKGVKKLPRSVVSESGFSPVKEFQESVKDEGFAFITKRSELGQGELKPQKFIAPSGKTVIESGTKEIEAVIPTGSKFEYTPKTIVGKVKGFEKFTRIEGTNVPIRTAKLQTGSTKGFIESPAIEISGQQIQRESSSFSSLVSGVKKKSPTPSILSSLSKLDIGAPKLRSSVSESKKSTSKTSGSVFPQSSFALPTISKPSKPTSFSPFSSISRTIKPSSVSSLSFSSIKSSSIISPVSSVSQKGSQKKKRLPELDLKFEGEKRTKSTSKKKVKQETRFTPSLISVVGKITGKVPKQTKFTGLEIRPIQNSRRGL